MSNRTYKEKERIIKRMIDSIIVPQDPQIQDVIINSTMFRGIQSHNILIVADDLDIQAKRKIEDEIQTLYKMATLSSDEPREFVDVHFG